MTTYKFRSSTIDPEQVDQLAKQSGCDSRAEYLRMLVRNDAQRKDTPLTTDAE